MWIPLYYRMRKYVFGNPDWIHAGNSHGFVGFMLCTIIWLTTTCMPNRRIIRRVYPQMQGLLIKIRIKARADISMASISR